MNFFRIWIEIAIDSVLIICYLSHNGEKHARIQNNGGHCQGSRDLSDERHPVGRCAWDRPDTDRPDRDQDIFPDTGSADHCRGEGTETETESEEDTMQRMTEEEFESILEGLWKVQTTGVGFQMTANESLAIQGWRKHKNRADALEAENHELRKALKWSLSEVGIVRDSDQEILSVDGRVRRTRERFNLREL